jgi:hypothetical protein
MKRLVLALLAVLLVTGVSFAEDLNIGDTITKIPGLKQGIGYSFKDSDIDYLTTVEAFKFKGASVEAGYSYKDEVIAVISYDLLHLSDLGVNIPILDLIEFHPGLYAGYSRVNIERPDKSRFDFGISLTLIKVKF